MNKLQRLPLGGAVDLDGKAHGIDDASLRKQQNIIPDKDGYPGRRPGLQYFADLWQPNNAKNAAVADNAGAFVTTQYTNNPVWCDAPKDFPATVAALVTDGTRSDLFVALMNDAGVSTNIRKLQANVSLPCMFSYGGITYFVYGQSPTRTGVGLKLVVSGTDPGFTLQDFDWLDAQTLVTKPRYACAWRSRFLYAHFEGDYKGTVVISDIGDPLTIGENALTDFGVEVTGGREITGVHEVLSAGQGSPVSAIVLVMTSEKSYYLSGDLPLTTDTFDASAPYGTLQVNKLSSNAGCLSHHSIVDTPYGVIWCGPTDVWFLPIGTVVPVPIGRRLKPMLKAQPEESRYRIHATYSGGFYRLALFSDGQGPDDTTPLGEQWWLDLRNGAPTSWKDALWHGPMVFNVASSILGERSQNTTVLGTSFMAVDNREGQDNRLFGVHHGHGSQGNTSLTLVAYDSTDPRDVGGLFRTGLVPWPSGSACVVGQEIVVDNAAYNAANGRGTVAIWRVSALAGDETTGNAEPSWDIASSPITDHNVTWTFYGLAVSPSQMAGSEILTIIESKDYNFSDLMSDKLFLGIELSYFLTLTQRLKLTMLLDGGKTVDEITADCTPGSGPVMGAGVLGTDRLAEEFMALSILSADGTRSVGKRGQVRLEEVVGVTLPPDYRRVGIVFGVTEYHVDLGVGYFADLGALAAAICLALNTDVTIRALLGSDIAVGTSHNKIQLFATNAWAPSIATAEIRYIWSLLGFSSFNNQDNTPSNSIIGDEIPYDFCIGDIAYEETNLKYQQFRRRPNS